MRYLIGFLPFECLGGLIASFKSEHLIFNVYTLHTIFVQLNYVNGESVKRKEIARCI